MTLGAAGALAAGVWLAGAPALAAPRAACHSASSHWLVRWTQTFAGRARSPLQVYRRPGGTPFMQLGTTDSFGFPTTVSLLQRVHACGASWYRVRLPMRPNGATGWVRSADVKTTRLHTRILVDLSQHRLYLYRRGRLVLRARVGIGKPSTPTPRGSFFVTERFVVTTPSAYGPRALGISAFSNVLLHWVDGGPIGIHGTDEPSSVGASVSHGCIRLDNTTIVRLFGLTPLGTPVRIRA